MQITPRVKAYAMLLCVALIWGVASPIIKYTLDYFSPSLFLTYRFGISTIIALITFFIYGFHIPKNFKTILFILFYGFLNTVVSLGLLFYGMNDTTVLETSLIVLINPLLISTAGVYFLKEHITRREKIGMGIAILGTILTITEPFIQNGDSLLKFSGNLLILGYVIINVVLAVWAKKLLRDEVRPLTISNIGFMVGFVSFLAIVLTTSTFHDSIQTIMVAPLKYHLGVFYMAVISGSLAYFLWTKAQKSIEIGEVSLFSYLNPIFSIPLAIFWLNEKITPIFILGAIIICIGVAVAEIKKKRYNS